MWSAVALLIKSMFVFLGSYCRRRQVAQARQ